MKIHMIVVENNYLMDTDENSSLEEFPFVDDDVSVQQGDFVFFQFPTISIVV